MQNMLQLQDDLKNFSEQQLVREMQMPSGQVPQFLILTELGRRKRIRDDFSRQQAAGTPTVAEETVAAAGMPVGASTDMAKAMAPKTSMAENTGIGEMMPKQPTRMAEGGDVEPRNRFEMLMAYLRSLREKEEEPKPTSTGPSIAEMINFGGDYEPVKKAEGGVVKMAPGGSVGMPVEPFPASSPNPRDRGRWMQKYKDTHNLDGSPKSLSPDLAMQEGIGSLSADTGDYMPPSIAMQTQSKLSAATSPDRYVLRMTDPNPLGSAFMDEYRANMATASAPAQDSPTPEVFDATVPSVSSELVDTSIEDKTLTTPSIRGNDGSSERLELGSDLAVPQRETTDDVYNLFEDAKKIPLDPDYGQPTLKTDSITSRLSREGPETAALRNRKTSDENPTLDVDFADPTMVPDPSFQNPPDIQEKRDITPTSKVGELLNYFPDPAAALQDTFTSLASSLSGDNKAASASESEQGIAEFVEAEKLRPTTPTTKPNTKPNPDLPAGGGAKSALSGELGGMQGELAQYLKDMEKSREQDKWLALANMGLALMSSKQPTLGGAIGEAGMKGMKDLQAGKKAYSKDKLAIMALQQRIDAAKLAAQTSLDVANIRAETAGKGSASSANTTNRVMLKELLGEVNKELQLLTPLSGGAVPAENLDRYNELVRQRTAIIREMEKLTTLPILGDTDSTELAGVFDVPTSQ